MPTLASTSRTQLSMILEAVFGTTPVTGSPASLRMTGESLNFTLGTAQSAEIRSDRQETDLAVVSAGAQGGFNAELSYAEYDPLIEAALQGTWLGCNDIAVAAATITLGTTITAGAGTPFANLAVGARVQFSGFTNAANNLPLTVVTASSTVITVAGGLTNEGPAAVNFTSFGKISMGAGNLTTSGANTLTASAGTPFANVVAGQWVRIAGMPTAGNNKVAQVVSKTSSLILVFAAATFTNEAGVGATFVSSRLSNGTVQRSFSLEKSYADISQFFTYRGMTVSKMGLKFASGAITSAIFDFMGKDQLRGAVTAMPSAPLASQTYDVQNAVAGVGNVFENGAALTGTYIKTLSLDIDNKLRGQSAIGTLGNVGIGSGTIALAGSLEVYLADGTLYDKFVANTASSLSLRTYDGAGNGYMITLPKTKYSDAKVNSGAKDQDAMIMMPFVGLMDATTGKSIIVDRI